MKLPLGVSVFVCLDIVHNSFQFIEYILNTYCAPNTWYKIIHKMWLVIIRNLYSRRGNRLRYCEEAKNGMDLMM